MDGNGMGWVGRKNQRECKATVPSPVAADTLQPLDWGLGTGDLGLGIEVRSNLYLGVYTSGYRWITAGVRKDPLRRSAHRAVGASDSGWHVPRPPERSAAVRYRTGTSAHFGQYLARGDSQPKVDAAAPRFVAGPGTIGLPKFRPTGPPLRPLRTQPMAGVDITVLAP
ncbi:hypothetical protein G7Z17_g8754 [Cylindrodendrum hubeiense]|uniref:Uncharacterized protein n=1 Tax=Cylindrodendrum hubeiense TaxID=595255 RepID=A0A9P5L8R1_9HYPO|nr:hypothetical protein G7Z17_g8754 [Cylindrodendrum hubeiense]